MGLCGVDAADMPLLGCTYTGEAVALLCAALASEHCVVPYPHPNPSPNSDPHPTLALTRTHTHTLTLTLALTLAPTRTRCTRSS